ncbi:MAG: class I SAM-dependent rRNA methyltransferase [Verrucomicrobiales bacterium]|nr:class I SAM-dependent rRNA methyltransferase [Verrucomicrobiales bacterium]
MAGLVIKPRSRIFHGHDWVYASEIQKAFGDPQPGDVVSLKDFKDRPLGTAIYNPKSQIVARRISRRKQQLDSDFFQRRIERAAGLRATMNLPAPEICRLVWSEADGLPGVVLDRYGPHFVVQTLTLAMDNHKADLADAIRAVFPEAESIIERNDSPVRKAEGLELTTGLLFGDDFPAQFEIEAAGIRQQIDLAEGQKTGIYLDQLDNYAAVAALAKDQRVLDCFCNQGGFALHAAKAGAASVCGVDIGEGAIESARKNAELNDLGHSVEWVVANVFDHLRHLENEGTRFDLIILDPPSFTRNRKSLKEAMRGYKDIHLRALRLLEKGGRLVTYSCSHHVSRSAFLDMICDASVDAKRTLRLIDEQRQRRDHPILATIPETSYLKGFVFETVAGF